MSDAADQPFLRIGELSRRVGVSEHLLRAWELRYGLINPARSEGGYRLYTIADERRVRQMLAYLSQGLAAAQAAHAAKLESERAGSGHMPPHSENLSLKQAYVLLREYLDQMNESGAQTVLDRLFTDFPMETVFRHVLLAYLDEMGARWVAKSLSVGQEHFASNIFRGRLAQFARGWGEGAGPAAVLACPPGEAHEFALLISGIMLHRNGWAITYLGTDTPIEDIIELTTHTRPELVLMSATVPERFAHVILQLRQLSALTPLVLVGRGAIHAIAEQCGAKVVEGDPVSVAKEIAKVIKTRN